MGAKHILLCFRFVTAWNCNHRSFHLCKFAVKLKFLLSLNLVLFLWGIYYQVSIILESVYLLGEFLLLLFLCHLRGLSLSIL